MEFTICEVGNQVVGVEKKSTVSAQITASSIFPEIKLASHEILHYLGFDVPTEGIVIYPNDARLYMQHRFMRSTM